jgi:hypothetical protein
MAEQSQTADCAGDKSTFPGTPFTAKDSLIWLLRDENRVLRRGAWIGMTFALLVGTAIGFGLRSIL